MRAIILASIVLSACSKTAQFAGECQKNGDCPVGSACRVDKGTSVGICICRSDEACGEGFLCNTQGVCQERAGCRINTDCGDTMKFCDIATGNCVDKGIPSMGGILPGCGTDVHCEPGSVCGASGTCTEGCIGTGDCPLYRVCDRTGLTSPTELGRCVGGRCDDKSFCAFGDRCTAGACLPDPNPNHCTLDCQGNATCGDQGRNFCLVNSAYDPQNPRASYESFCGVECDAEEDCPNGYNCGGVVLLTQDQCTNSGECGGGGRECFIGEGDLRGFCSCANDQDCAPGFAAPPSCSWGSCSGAGITFCNSDDQCLGTCDYGTRYCEWPQGRPCTQDTQCDALPICGPFAGPGFGNVCITTLPDAVPCGSDAECLCVSGSCANTGRPCVNGADCVPPCMGGGCVLGAACAPEEGLLCTDVD
jgi:hypothetical protein